MASASDNRSDRVDYIACDLPDDMTLAEFRRSRCAEQRRFPRLRDLSTRWLRRPPRD